MKKYLTILMTVFCIGNSFAQYSFDEAISKCHEIADTMSRDGIVNEFHLNSNPCFLLERVARIKLQLIDSEGANYFIVKILGRSDYGILYGFLSRKDESTLLLSDSTLGDRLIVLNKLDADLFMKQGTP